MQEVLSDKRITFTYTSPEGVVVVVTGVPAVVDVRSDGREEYAYPLDVAFRLEQIVQAALKEPSLPETVHSFRWDDEQLIQSKPE